METNVPTTNSAGTLAERAMLVSLRMSRWRAERIDRGISERVASEYKMTAQRAGKYAKYLIDPGTPSYRAVCRAYGDMRTRYYWHTLPWAHHGARIVPAVSFHKYSEDMRKCEQARQDAVNAFTAEWPRLATLSVAESNGLITASDLPDNIRDCFGIDLQVMPIPTVGDLRVQMSAEDAARVKAQMQAGVDAQIREALTVATRDGFERLYKHVSRMVERLSDKDASFHDSLIVGLRDLCAILPALNITDDPQLEVLRDTAERMVAGVEPGHLRDVPLIRERVCQDAKALQEKLAPHVAVNASIAPASDAVIREAAGMEAAMGNMFNFARSI